MPPVISSPASRVALMTSCWFAGAMLPATQGSWWCQTYDRDGTMYFLYTVPSTKLWCPRAGHIFSMVVFSNLCVEGIAQNGVHCTQLQGCVILILWLFDLFCHEIAQMGSTSPPAETSLSFGVLPALVVPLERLALSCLPRKQSPASPPPLFFLPVH